MLNAKRGQTPYTQLLLFCYRLMRDWMEQNDGGVKVEIERTTNLANDFKNKIKEFPKLDVNVYLMQLPQYTLKKFLM